MDKNDNSNSIIEKIVAVVVVTVTYVYFYQFFSFSYKLTEIIYHSVIVQQIHYILIIPIIYS